LPFWVRLLLSLSGTELRVLLHNFQAELKSGGSSFSSVSALD